jgi:hypothetical protein
MDRSFFILLLIPAVFLAGCCGTSAPSSSGFCPYGTYGESCTRACKIFKGGPDCFEQCIDSVRSEGLGDATTCCKETNRMNCENKCRQQFQGEALQECLEMCDDIIKASGVPEDMCYLPIL